MFEPVDPSREIEQPLWPEFSPENQPLPCSAEWEPDALAKTELPQLHLGQFEPGAGTSERRSGRTLEAWQLALFYLYVDQAKPSERAAPCPVSLPGRAEYRPMLVGELAFAFLISLAGASRRRDPEISSNQTAGADATSAAQAHDSDNNKECDGGERLPGPALDAFFSALAGLRPLPAIATAYGAVPARTTYGAAPVIKRLPKLAKIGFLTGETGDDEGKAMIDRKEGACKNEEINCAPDSNSDSIPAMAPLGNAEELDKEPVRLTVQVKEEDTLASIAEDMFHDSDVSWLIADLNKGRTREYWMDGKRIVRVKIRQQLFLPTWRDIIRFYQGRPAVARAQNLITVVESSRVDIKLLDAELSPIIGRLK